MRRKRAALVTRPEQFDPGFLDFLGRLRAPLRSTTRYERIRNTAAIRRKALDVKKAILRFPKLFAGEIAALDRIIEAYPRTVEADRLWRTSPRASGPPITKRQSYVDLTALVVYSAYLRKNPDWKEVQGKLVEIGRPVPKPRYYWQRFISSKLRRSRRFDEPISAGEWHIGGPVLRGAFAYLMYRRLRYKPSPSTSGRWDDKEKKYLAVAAKLLPGLKNYFFAPPSAYFGPQERLAAISRSDARPGKTPSGPARHLERPAAWHRRS